MCLVISDSLRGMSLQEKWKCEGPASHLFFFKKRGIVLPTCRLTHSFRPKIRDTPGGARNVLHLGALSVPSRIGGERSTRTYLTVTRWFVTFGAHAWLLSSQFTVWQAFCCCCFLCQNFLYQVGSADGNPSGSLLENRSRRPTWRIGCTQVMILPKKKVLRISLRLCRSLATKVTSPNQNYVMMHLQHLDQRRSLMLFPGNLLAPGYCILWERNEAPLSPLRPRCNFIHTRQLSPLPERLKLPFSSDEIFSGFEEIVSSSTDQFTAWVRTDSHATLVRHMVDVQQKLLQIFAKHQKGDMIHSSQTSRFSKGISNRSPAQKRLSIYNWNPGPRRGKEDAFEKQIAGRWDVITCRRHLSMSTMTFLLVGST